jgi:hypothetical protein
MAARSRSPPAPEPFGRVSVPTRVVRFRGARAENGQLLLPDVCAGIVNPGGCPGCPAGPSDARKRVGPRRRHPGSMSMEVTVLFQLAGPYIPVLAIALFWAVAMRPVLRLIHSSPSGAPGRVPQPRAQEARRPLRTTR